MAKSYTHFFEGMHFDVYLPAPNHHSTIRNVTLLLHGMFGSALDMGQIARAFCSDPAERHHIVLVPDLPFHARSAMAQVDSPRAVAERLILGCKDISDPMAADKRPTLTVVGYSLGGRIALEVANLPLLPSIFELKVLVLISSGLPVLQSQEVEEVTWRHKQVAVRLRSFADENDFRGWLKKEWYVKPMWGSLSDSAEFPNLLDSRVSSISNAVRLGIPFPMAMDKLASAVTLLSPCHMSHIDGRSFCTGVKVAGIANAGHNVIVENPHHVLTVLTRFMLPLAEAVELSFELKDVRMWPYSLPMKNPMSVGTSKILTREGLLVVLRGTNEKEIGIGDVAPLPGLHAESISSCYTQIRMWAMKSRSTTLGLESCRQSMDVSPPGRLASFDMLGELYPSVRAGMCSAIAQCIAAKHSVNALELLRAMTARWTDEWTTVKINATVPRPVGRTDVLATTYHILDRVRSRSERSVVKLKVGVPENMNTEASIVHSLADEMRSARCMLRLDANCSWTVDEFELFSASVEPVCDIIEFIEEPLHLKSRDGLFEIYNSICEDVSGRPFCLRVALDETLVPYSVPDTLSLIEARGVTAIVLKPSVQGDLSRLLLLAEKAINMDKKVILSSVFDSGVGLAWTTVLACVVGNPRSVAHGIGTFAALEDDWLCHGFANDCINADGDVLVLRAIDYLRRCARLVEEHGVATHEDSLEAFKSTFEARGLQETKAFENGGIRKV